jgi:hypothetical protein
MLLVITVILKKLNNSFLKVIKIRPGVQSGHQSVSVSKFSTKTRIFFRIIPPTGACFLGPKRKVSDFS